MMSKIFKTVDEEMTFLTEYAGATEDFLQGAIAIGGYNEETMNGACYYLTGYTTIDSYYEEMTFLTKYAEATEDFIHRFFVQFSY